MDINIKKIYLNKKKTKQKKKQKQGYVTVF